MIAMNVGPLVAWSAACAFIAVAASAVRASCQALPQPPAEQKLMRTPRPSDADEIRLGAACLTGSGDAKDESQAAYWYEKAAEAGDPWAQQQIGFFYQVGIGVPVDPARAVHWYQLAAAEGQVSAKTNLGVAWLWGSGVPMDARMAARLFREAADKGDGTAAAYLGDLYYSGRGLPRDPAAGEHWYKVGAKLHNPMAEFNLGLLDSVEDHPHDFPKAAHWLRRSIHDGYVPAMHSLGLLLETHPELAKSSHEFLELLTAASGYGQWKSSEALALLYTEGRLVPRNPATACYYLQLAALQGRDQAPEQNLHLRQALSAELGAEQAAKQDAAAQAWYSQHREIVEQLLDGPHGHRPAGLAMTAPAQGVHAGQLVAAPPS